MEMSNGAIGAIAALCVTAGAAGMYVTTGRQAEVPLIPIESVAAAPGPESTASQAAPVATQPVAVASGPVARATRRAAAPAPARRASTVERERNVEPPNAWSVEPVVEAAPRQRAAAATWTPRESDDSQAIERVASAAPDFIELTVPADSVLGLQIESPLTSETAELEDEVVARVARDVRVNDRVAIPSGAQVHGVVALVERGGKLRERARIGVRFTSAVLADGTRIALSTDTIVREGSSPGGESAAKIGGGAIGGAIIGGIIGGTRGAVIGGSVGAGAGTTAVMVGGRNAATFPAGTSITARLIEPVTVTIDY